METLLTDKRPIAKKEYNCMACDWLWNAGQLELLLNSTELQQIEVAKSNSYKIQKGEQYVRQTGIQDGELITFIAIPEMHDICLKYDLYDE